MLPRATSLVAVLLLLLQPWLTLGNYVRSLTSTVLSRAKRIGENVQRLQPNTVLFIDGDNVRGKTGFSVSKERLAEDVLQFQQRFGFSHRVVLLFDHGAEHEGFALTCQQHPEASLALVFSGAKTADDIIARDCGYFLRVARVPVCVVTSDAGLKGRCQRAAKSAPWAVEGGTSIVGQGAVRPVSFIDSNTFIELLGAVASGELDVNDTSVAPPTATEPTTPAFVPMSTTTTTITTTPTTVVIDTDAAVAASRADSPDDQAAATPLDPLQSTRLAELARRELRLRQQVRSLDTLLERKSQGRKKLVRLRERRGEIVRALDKLLVEGGAWSLDEASDGRGEEGQEGADGEEEEEAEREEAARASIPPRQADAAFVDSLLLLGAGRGKEGGYREETWQRCILAERLRASVLMHVVTSLAATTASTTTAAGDDAGADSAKERAREAVSALPFSRTTAVFPAFPSATLDAALPPSAAEPAPIAAPATFVYLREINRAYSRTNLAKLVDLCSKGGGRSPEAPGAGAGVGLGMGAAAISSGTTASAAGDGIQPPTPPALAAAAAAAADDRLALLRAAIGPASLAAALPPQARKAMVQAGVGWKGRKGSGKRRG